MRGLFLLAIFLFLLASTLTAAYAGVLAWTWVAVMSPHSEVFGFVNTLRLNYLISIVALLAWLFSKEPKTPSGNRALVWVGVFVFFTSLTTLAAWDRAFSYPYWLEFLKTFALLYLVACTANSRLRVHALILVIFASLAYWGVKGGVFSLVSGGGSIVYGPAKSQINDNNKLALALTMSLPFALYLYYALSHKLAKFAVIGAGALMTISILISYSRGAFVALTLMGMYWILTNRKFKTLAAASVVVVVGLVYLPTSWFERMDTISTYEEDGSAQGRFDAWATSFNIAREDPLTGGGFTSIEIPTVYFSHHPNSTLTASKSAHSIWFQVMGDHGFAGFAIYLFIAFLTWRGLTYVQKNAGKIENLVWAVDLTKVLKLSLIGFWAGGSFLSMAYYDVYFIIVILTGTLVAKVRLNDVEG